MRRGHGVAATAARATRPAVARGEHAVAPAPRAWRAARTWHLLGALGLVLACTRPARATASWRADVPCGRDLGAPRPVGRAGCAAAHCVTGPDALEVCACRPTADGAAERVRFTVRGAGRAEQTWSRETLLGDTGSFRAQLADLDGDGRPEVLVGAIESVSNGMAVQYWSLCVSDARRRGAAPPCVALEDHPFYGMATRAPHERACRVLETHWRWGSEPKRGEGLYLVGRWLAYRGGELSPDATRPLVARRYLYGFAAARRDVIESARTAPVAWWRDPRARTVHCPDRLCEAAPP